MKLTILAIVLVAFVVTPMMSFACPPPPAPGYDGGESGAGPLPGDDHSNGYSDGGGQDSETGSGSSDADVADEVC